MDRIDDRFLSRNGHAARRLAGLLLQHEVDSRLPRLRDFAKQLGVGNGTVQAALRLLEDAGAVETVARGHLGTFLTRCDRNRLWQLAGLGTLLAAMPLPYSRRYEGLATGLREAFEAAGAPFAITFMRGGATRVEALLERKADLVVLSRFAADRMLEEHPVELVADLGPATYVGAHGMLLRSGADLDAPGLRVAVDSASEDQRLLAELAFAGRETVPVESSYMQLRDLFARGEVDVTVWNLDEARDHLGPGVEVLPLGNEITRDLALRNSSAALLARSDDAEGALAAIRDGLDLSAVADVQGQVLRGERIPSY